MPQLSRKITYLVMVSGTNTMQPLAIRGIHPLNFTQMPEGYTQLSTLQYTTIESIYTSAHRLHTIRQKL